MPGTVRRDSGRTNFIDAPVAAPPQPAPRHTTGRAASPLRQRAAAVNAVGPGSPRRGGTSPGSPEMPMELAVTRPLAEVTLGGTFVAPDTIVACAASHGSDAGSVWTVEMNGWLRLRDGITGAVQHQQRIRSHQEPTTLLIAADKVWVGLAEGLISVFRVSDKKHLADCIMHEDSVSALATVEDVVASAGVDGRVALWDPTTMSCVSWHQCRGDGPVNCVLHSETYGGLFANSEGHTVSVFRLGQWERTRTFVGHTADVLSMCIGGGTLWTGSEDCSLRTWNIATGACERTIEFHTQPVHSLLRVPGESKVWSCGMDGAVALWDADTCDLLGQLPVPFPKGKQHFVFALAPIAQATIWRLWACGTDGCVHSWLSQSAHAGGDAQLLDEVHSLKLELQACRRENAQLTRRVPFTEQELAEFMGHKREQHAAEVEELRRALDAQRAAQAMALDAVRESLWACAGLEADEQRRREALILRALGESAALHHAFTRSAFAHFGDERAALQQQLGAAAHDAEAAHAAHRSQSEEAQHRLRAAVEAADRASVRAQAAEAELQTARRDGEAAESEAARLRETLRARDETVLAQRERIQLLLQEHDAALAHATAERRAAEAALHEQTAAAERAATAAETAIARLTAEVGELQRRNASLEDRNLVLDAAADGHLASIDALQADREELRCELHGRCGEVEALREAAQSLAADHAAELEEMRAQLCDERHRAAVLTSKVEQQLETEEELREYRDAAERLRRELRVRNDEVARLSRELEGSVAQQQVSEAARSELELEVEQLRQRLAAEAALQHRETETLLDSATAAQRAQERCEAELASTTAELAALQATHHQAQECTEHLQRQLATSAASDSAARAALRAEEERCDSLQRALDERDEDVARANVAIKALRAELGVAQDGHAAERVELQHQLERAQRELDRVRDSQQHQREGETRALELQEELHALVAERQRLQRDAAELRQQLSTAEAEAARARNAAERASSELAALRRTSAERAARLEVDCKVLREQSDMAAQQASDRASAEAARRMAELAEELRAAVEQRDEALDESQRTTALLAECSASLGTASAEAAEFAAKVEALERLVGELRREAASSDARREEDVGALRARLEAADAQTAGLQEATVALMRELRLKTAEAERLDEESRAAIEAATTGRERDATNLRCDAGERLDALEAERAVLERRAIAAEHRALLLEEMLNATGFDARGGMAEGEERRSTNEDVVSLARDLRSELDAASIALGAAAECDHDLLSLADLTRVAVERLREMTKRGAASEAAEAVELRQQLVEAQREREAAEAGIAVLHERSQHRITELEARLAEADTAAAAVRMQLDEAASACVALEAQLAGVGGVSRMAMRAVEGAEELARRLVDDSFQAALEALQWQHVADARDHEIGELERSLDELAAAHTVAMSELAALRREADEGAAMMQEQDDAVMASGEAVRRLQREHALLLEKLEGAGAEVRALREARDAARHECGLRDAALEQASLELQTARGAVERVELARDESAHEASTLRERLKEETQALVAARAEVGVRDEQLRELPKLRTALATLERDCASQQRAIRALEGELAEARSAEGDSARRVRDALDRVRTAASAVSRDHVGSARAALEAALTALTHHPGQAAR